MSDIAQSPGAQTSGSGRWGPVAPAHTASRRPPGAGGRQFDWYRAYTEWRRQHPRQESTRFFRGNRNASMIWMLVMRGHYLGTPPSLTECFTEARCSRGTARAILRAATAKGYFVLARAPDDHRRTLIQPSPLCVTEFQRMVDAFLRLSETLSHAAHTTERHESPNAGTVRWYAAYARWRFERKRSTPIRPSCKFFRRSRDHTEIWITMMHGHYTGVPATISDCLAGVHCSRDTGRKIIFEAEKAGFLTLSTANEDSRKRHVLPTAQCVSEYEAMVDTFLSLGDVLQHRDGTHTRRQEGPAPE